MNQLNKGISEKLDASNKGLDQIGMKSDKHQKTLTAINNDMNKILKK